MISTVLERGALVLLAIVLAGIPGETLHAQSGLVGTWLGKIAAGGGVEVRLVFNVTEGDDGSLSATMDSPDQGATGIPVSEVVHEGSSVRFMVAAAGAGTGYEGTLSDDGMTIEGAWNQGGGSAPLTLERTEGEVEGPKRPQEPKGPVPYLAEDVTYENPEAGIRLAGTLTIPESGGPFPGVVLVSGSGAQNRDEALLGHKPFLVLADYLTRRGIAVLRFDDRGVAESGGDHATATSEDFASDALAGARSLQGDSRLDPDNVGIAGHSEGGLIGPIAAVKSDDVGFIVMLAGPGLTGEEILYLQGALIARANGASEEAVEKSRKQQEDLFAVIKNEPDPEKAAQRLTTIMQASFENMTEAERAEFEASGVDQETIISGQIARINAPWFRYFLTHDPVPTLERLKVPVLSIIGTKDLQVPSRENSEAIEAALKRGGNENFVVRELEGLNHLFQHAETGSPSEYQKIEETFAPSALQIVGDWIVEQTGKARVSTR